MKWTVYSDWEGPFLRRWHARRVGLLAPLLNCFTRIGITPNSISVLSGIFGLAFLPLITINYAAAVYALILHMLLDSLDGPLATYTKTASNKGMLVDFTCDLIGIVATTIGLTLTGYITPFLSLLYLSLYIAISFTGVMQSILNIKQSWSFRPRFWIYGAVIGLYVLESRFHIRVDVIQPFAIIACFLMLGAAVSDFRRLHAAAGK